MKEKLIKIENLLRKAGFLDKETAVYLAMLEMGRGVVSEISRKAGVNRTTGYVLLDSLTNKGLVSVSGKKPKQEYMVESPENLAKYLHSEIEKQKTITKELDKLLPEMTSLYKKGDRPQVRFYEGVEGLKYVYEDTLTATEPIVAYATYDDMHKALPGYFPDYYKRRAKKGIFARGIVPATPLAYERLKENKNEARELALVPAKKYLFSPDIEIYDNKIMIASWREKLGIIIESGEIADAMKKIFELAWIAAKQMDNKN
jgi:HTH-type transcriptional regulator, sugar sensing transcriptional regulator